MPSQKADTLYSRLIKPLVDLLMATAVLLITSPLLIIIWVVLAIANRGSAFFVQARIGKGAVPFKVIKFQTMNNDRGPDGSLKPDHDRLTTLGKFVRKTSLDELPQMFNILR